MKAAICDRCRQMVDPHDAGGGEVNVSELDPVDNARRGPKECLGDLCNECVTDLKKWIRKGKVRLQETMV